MVVNENPTRIFFNCRKCLSCKPDGISPANFARINVGFDEDCNIVVWCLRHDELIASFNPRAGMDVVTPDVN